MEPIVSIQSCRRNKSPYICEVEHLKIKKVNLEKKPKQVQKNNPLHGVKLAEIVEFLVKVYGWKKLGSMIDIRCFNFDPSVKSSLKFLRKTPWARAEVEDLYLYAKDKYE